VEVSRENEYSHMSFKSYIEQPKLRSMSEKIQVFTEDFHFVLSEREMCQKKRSVAGKEII
jgi:hypothetical protein